MANTADTLGEQETLDGLVAHTLDDFEDDRITSLRSRAFYHNDKIKTINLPNLNTLEYGKGDASFIRCFNLISVNIPKVSKISTCFEDCYKLKTVNASFENLTGSNVFTNCHSLNSIDLSNVKELTSASLSKIGMGTIILPKCKSFSYIITEGTRPSTVDIYNNVALSTYAFRSSYSLVHLIFRNNNICNLTNTSAFNNTPIANGLGWIYVPSGLVESYKTASNWSTYANQIVSLDEYPKALSGETITDSWDEIFQAEENGSYKTKYSVGDTKYLVVGGTYVLMQIIAFDRDILSSDHTSTAKITWLAKGLSFQFPMNFEDATKGGWADCECRKFLSDTIYGQIPENVRNKIVAVDKTYTATSSSSSTATVSDKLWIPSAREIYGGSSYENTGVDYTDFFTGNSVRIKHDGLLTNNASYWWLRSVNSSTNFRNVSNSGNVNSGIASGSYRVALGFCT